MSTPCFATSLSFVDDLRSATLDISDTFDRDAALEVIVTHPIDNKLMDLTFLEAISTPKSGYGKKKRTLSLSDEKYHNCEGDDHHATSADGSDSNGTPPRRSDAAAPAAAQQTKKQRKPTHVVRREAKETLKEEVRELEARVALLRQEAGLPDPSELTEKLALSAELREALLQQDLVLANSQSTISGYTSSRTTSPLETYIHLTKDWTQRRDVLLGMKDRKICDANRFLVERTRHMNPFKASSEVSQFESEEGDLCTIKIDVTPFEDVKSVRQVFDAMHFYFMNLEISQTEMSGNVTIRENDDNTEQAVLHHRLVTAEPSGVFVEKNAVVFIDQSDFDDANVKAEDQWAIAVGDFVDQDDLYPYCPMQRLRKDATSVLKLSAHRRPKQRAPSNAGATCDGESTTELVVVMTRYHFARVRRPAFDLPQDTFQAITSAHTTEIDVMLRSMRQGIFSASAPAAMPWSSK